MGVSRTLVPGVVACAILGAWAGCLEAAQPLAPGPLGLHYELEVPGRSGRALVEWRSTGDVVDVRDADGFLHRAVPVGIALRFPDETTPVVATYLVDAEHGIDLLVLNDCAPDAVLECPKAFVEWNTDRIPIAWFGAAVLPQLQVAPNGTAAVRVGGTEHSFDATPVGDDLRLVPHVRPDEARQGPLCNLLEDETLVDLRRGLIVECTVRGEVRATARLTSPRTALPTRASDSATQAPSFASPFLPFAPREGPIPPEADYAHAPDEFTLKAAHEAAKNRSDGLARFLLDHPEAGLEAAGPRARSETGLGPGLVVTRTASYELTYVASGGTGYQVRVERTDRFLDGLRLARDYTITAEGAWTPPDRHRWESMEPPAAELASVRRVLTGLADVVPAWQPTSYVVLNDAPHAAHRPLYRYYVSLKGGACEAEEAAACAANSVAVDAATGLLQGATLMGSSLAALFGSPEAA